MASVCKTMADRIPKLAIVIAFFLGQKYKDINPLFKTVLSKILHKGLLEVGVQQKWNWKKCAYHLSFTQTPEKKWVAKIKYIHKGSIFEFLKTARPVFPSRCAHVVLVSLWGSVISPPLSARCVTAVLKNENLDYLSLILSLTYLFV